MFTKIILNSLLITLLAIVQFSFISSLPNGFNNLNLILVIIVYILSGLKGLDHAIYWVVGLGFLMDIFSFSYFGINLINLILTLIIANFLLNNFFTNRSLYSFLALTFLVTLIYEIFLNGSHYIFNLIEGEKMILNNYFFLAKATGLGLNLLFSLLLFYLINIISNRLKPVFLIKSKIITNK